MKRANLWLALFAVAVLGTAARAESNPIPEPEPGDPFAGEPRLEKASLVDAVLERNPTVEAARQAWAAALEEIPQASSLEDPMLSYSFAPQSIASSDSRFGEVLRVGQRLPYPGTLRLRSEVARAEAAVAQLQVEEVRLRLASMASFLYDDYWLVQRSLSITQEHIDLIEVFKRVATSRYATGVATQQAPIQAEVEGAHLLHQQVSLGTELRQVRARLNRLLHRPPGAPLPPPPERLDTFALVDGHDGDHGDTAPIRPEVAAQEQKIESLRRSVSLEKLELKPDFEATTSYNSMWGNQKHRFMVGIGVRLPVWRKRLHASVAEAESRLAQSESELDALLDDVSAEVEIALAAIEESEHVVRLYRSRVLPAARDLVAAARAGFETGDGSMMGLIDAQRSLLGAQLNHEEAIARLASARVELDRATGRITDSRRRLWEDSVEPTPAASIEKEQP